MLFLSYIFASIYSTRFPYPAPYICKEPNSAVTIPRWIPLPARSRANFAFSLTYLGPQSRPPPSRPPQAPRTLPVADESRLVDTSAKRRPPPVVRFQDGMARSLQQFIVLLIGNNIGRLTIAVVASDNLDTAKGDNGQFVHSIRLLREAARQGGAIEPSKSLPPRESGDTRYDLVAQSRRICGRPASLHGTCE